MNEKQNAPHGRKTTTYALALTALIGLAIALAPAAAASDTKLPEVFFDGGGLSTDNCNGDVEVNGCEYPDPHTGQNETCAVWYNRHCYVGT